MIDFNFPGYRISIELHKEPTLFELWLEHASFTDVEGLSNEGSPIYIGVGNEGHWFETVIAFRTEKLDTGGFVPGILVVPETHTLFVGAGETIRIYDLSAKTLKLENRLFGFWGWSRHDDIIIMSAELEFVAYSLAGEELWTAFVEPPWTYTVVGREVHLNVMEEVSVRDLKTGSLK